MSMCVDNAPLLRVSVFCLYVREVPYAQSVCFVLFPFFVSFDL